MTSSLVSLVFGSGVRLYFGMVRAIDPGRVAYGSLLIPVIAMSFRR